MAALTYVNSSSVVSGGTIARPAGVQDGDLLVASCWRGNAPSGWTELMRETIASGYGIAVYYKIASSEPSSYTFVNVASQITISAWRGRDAAIHSFDSWSGTSSSIQGPSLLATGDATLIFIAGANNTGVDSIGPASGMTSRVALDGLRRVFDQGVISGSTGTKSALATPDDFGAVKAGFTLLATGSNTPPNAPLVDDQGPFNRAETNRVGWGFSDSDTGDQQSAAEVIYADSGAQAAYIGNPSNFWDSPPGTFVDDVTALQVRTADQAGAWGPFSETFYVTAGVEPGTATWLAPTNGETITTSEYEAQISVVALDASEWRSVADDGAGNPDTSVIYQGPVLKETGDLRRHTFTFPVNNRVEHLQQRIRDGLWSKWASIRNPISYTPPADPTWQLIDLGTQLRVDIVNPPPATGEPAAAYNEVLIDDGLGAGEELYAEAPANTAWIYPWARSGKRYDGTDGTSLRVIAVGTNGTRSS